MGDDGSDGGMAAEDSAARRDEPGAGGKEWVGRAGVVTWREEVRLESIVALAGGLRRTVFIGEDVGPFDGVLIRREGAPDCGLKRSLEDIFFGVTDGVVTSAGGV